MQNVIVAIDYSMSCPAMCIRMQNDWRIYFLTKIKKYADVFLKGKIIGSEHFDWFRPEQRYDNISNHFMNHLKNFNPDDVKVFIEGYSMGSKGAVFNIGENQGILKYKLYKAGFKFEEVPPTVLKKFATGKGNADKTQMAAAFASLTNYDLSDLGKIGNSPSSDIIDAYLLAEYGACTLKESGSIIETP